MVLEGVADPDVRGTLTLDDFAMSPICELSPIQNLPGGDDLTTPSPVCLPPQLACGNGLCYYPEDICNFIDDCGDGTDELQCSKLSVVDSGCEIRKARLMSSLSRHVLFGEMIRMVIMVMLLNVFAVQRIRVIKKIMVLLLMSLHYYGS